MSDFETMFTMETLSFSELFLRIGLATFFGFVIGFDRDRKDKPIDFRAYIIVCIATCVIAIMGMEMIEIYSHGNGSLAMDIGKIISGVMTGIGFLGAGAIIHSGDTKVIGTATGASIWAAGAMGLALGFGLYVLATVCFLALTFVLVFGGWWMKRSPIDRADKVES